MIGCMKLGVVTVQTHARRQQTAAFSSNCCFKLSSKPTLAPFTVHIHNVIKGCFIFRIVYNFSCFRLSGLCINGSVILKSMSNKIISWDLSTIWDWFKINCMCCFLANFSYSNIFSYDIITLNNFKIPYANTSLTFRAKHSKQLTN